MALPKGINLRLKSVAKIKNLAERSVQISSVLAEALRTIGQDPILVGGAAVEFYTQGGYSTSDIDLIAEGGPKLMGVMKELGFNRLGKDFIHKEFKIYVEFPGRSLKPSERYQTLQIENRHLFIISLEDLIVDRLSAFKFWKSAIDGVNAMLLLEAAEIDEERLQERAYEDEVIDALKIIREIKETVIRKKLTPEQSNALLVKKLKSLSEKNSC